MTEFLIGFEFEFGWLPSTFPMKKPKSKPVFFETFIFPEVFAKLNQDFPAISLEIKEDCTLKFHSSNQKYWETYYGVEVVSQPMPEKEAMLFLSTFIQWLQKQHNIEINHTCSLHLNINFKDKNINHNIDYWKLLEIYPQADTLKRFNRQNNPYCQNTHLVKVGYEQDSYISKERTLSYWKNKIHDNFKFLTLKVIKKSFNSERYEYSKQNKEFYTLSGNSMDLLQHLNLLFQKKIFSMKKNLSIVKKNEDNPYYEFRMIGNKNYHLRLHDIIDTLNLSKVCLLQSIPH